MESVSYTHLDVYKRQVIYDEINSRTTNNKMTIISLMEKLKNSYGMMIGRCV